MRVFLDCDPGVDDALALMVLAQAPQVELLGISAVAGNQTVDKTTYNVGRLLALYGRTDVPYAKGMASPLIRPLVTAGEVHGETGLDGAVLPEPAHAPVNQHGVSFLIDTIMSSSEKVILIPTGPMTNVAVALREEPKLKDHIERLVFMGGGLQEGNITPVAEFNMYVDAEAAHLVLQSGLPITMVGLNVTHKILFDQSDIARMRSLGGQAGQALAGLFTFYGKFHDEETELVGFPVHDVNAVLEALEPGLFRPEPYSVAVEYQSELTYGQTVVDLYGKWGKAKNVNVAMHADTEAVRERVYAALSSYGGN